uniref:Pentatricopeptide repeat protein n=1 Tax=Salvia miltiorrhiza TaxID=226208 RepID=A0A678WDK0_SALMI|nr:pentatricopeptide repeat protein [Salvia miltiorrhiza]
MSKAILRLIKPLNRPPPRIKSAVKILITPQIKNLANEVCEILRSEDKQWEESLQNRFIGDDITPSEVAHLVFDKIRDCELGLKFYGFISHNSFDLDGFAYSSLLKLLARSRVFAEIDTVLLECLHSEEKRPTHEALGIVIRACAESGVCFKALELYSYLLRNYNALPQLPACNSLLNGLVKEGKLDAAWRVYEEMVRRDEASEISCLDNYSVSIMVKGLCKEGKVEKGRRLIEKRWGRNCIPNIVFYNILIDGYCKRGDLTRAHEFFEELKVKGFFPNQETYGAMIDGFCKRGEFEKVDQLRRIPLIYNNVVDGKCKYSLVGEAFETTRKMMEVGCPLDIVTYNSLISNACKDGNVLDAEKLLEEGINRGLVPNKLSFTPLIHAYCRERNFERASCLLVEMTRSGHKPDLITYGGLIHGLVVAGEVEAALTIRNNMVERGVSPDACIYNVLINGLCKKSRLADAEQLLQEMLGCNVSLDAYVYATLVDGYIRSGNFDDAEKLFDLIIKRGVDPGIVGYNAMIKGYCKLGKIKDAVLCINKMTRRNISPDEFTYSTIIDGFIKQNDLLGALTVFGLVIKQKYTPNVVMYTSIISGFCRCRHVSGAERILRGMQSNGVPPNVVTYSVMIGSCCKEGKLAQASSFFEEMMMSKCNPNDVTFHYLVNGLSNNAASIIQSTQDGSEWHKPMLLDIFGTMVCDGWHPISAAYSSIVACLCLNRMLGTALQLTDKMLNKGFPLDSVSLAALLHGACLVGKSKEWNSMITSKPIDAKLDVALKYLTIFGRYSTHELTKETSVILHSLLQDSCLTNELAGSRSLNKQ